MGIYDSFADAPNQIIIEGQDISITFKNNLDGTGTITWNIPPPSAGCNASNQAYNGILITVSNKASNYLSNSPKNGVMYSADASADPDVNTADTLDGALVVGAFYNDRTTTSLTISDVSPTKFYYISGYAVDIVGSYHREGVHAYSLPTGEAEHEAVDGVAYHNITIVSKTNNQAFIKNSTNTGLDPTKVYELHLEIDISDCDTYDQKQRGNYYLKIRGSEAQSYQTMIDAINKELTMVVPSYKNSVPPNAFTYYLDVAQKALYYWDGYTNTPKHVVFYPTDISLNPSGAYWFNPTSGIMEVYETVGWTPVPMISLDRDPTTPSCGMLWFTGTDVYEWDGDHWVKLCLYIQNRNPQLAPILTCNTYWYNANTGLISSWDMNAGKWIEESPIVSYKNPYTLSTGDFWYDETNLVMKRYVGGQWNLMTDTRYLVADPTLPDLIPNPTANSYWFDPSSQEFSKRSSNNTTWIPVPYTMAISDPLVHGASDVWWNPAPSIDQLYVWDSVNFEWKVVENFYQIETDPSDPPALPNCAVWYNPLTHELKYILNSSCTSPPYILSPFDPTNPPVGATWFNTLTGLYYEWNGAEWIEIYPIISTTDPFILTTNSYWFDTTNNTLYQWNGSSWNVVPFSSHPVTPKIGDKWFNTVTNVLNQWDGTQWVAVTCGLAKVSLEYVDRPYPNFVSGTFLHFYTCASGCGKRIEVIPESDTVTPTVKYGLLNNLAQSVIYNDAVTSSDGVPSGATWQQLGVGSDGSPDERRALHATIKSMLGAPSQQVELKKEQIDVCIDNALKMLRKYAGIAYTRQFFFLNAKPNQQTYILTDKCVGYNKVVHVKAGYRMRSQFMRTGYAGNDAFGVAALQQMYTIGTFDMLSFHLISSYAKELEQLFATRLMFQWNELTRELRFHQVLPFRERILLDASLERTDQDLITSRDTNIWLQNWAVAEAKMMLGQVRGKFQTLPGPTGSTSLNGQDLQTQSENEKTALMEQLYDPAMQGYTDVGMAAHFVIG